MLTEEHIKEGLSRAYVTALAHSAGMNCSIREHDYGIDGTFHEIRINKNGRRCENGFRIDFQLKSCINRNVSNDYITYDLEAKNYNDLVDTDIGAPRLLIVFFMPRNTQDWIKISEEELVLKHCAWWCSLRGKPETRNNRTKTIHIPNSQILDVAELQRLMSCVRNGANI